MNCEKLKLDLKAASKVSLGEQNKEIKKNTFRNADLCLKKKVLGSRKLWRGVCEEGKE